jgi:hypothetical protein
MVFVSEREPQARQLDGLIFMSTHRALQLADLFLYPAFLDKFAQFFEYFVAIEQFATSGLRGTAFQFRLQLLKRTIWLSTHGRPHFAD